MKEKVKIRPAVMSVTVILFVLMLAAILINGEAFYYVLNTVVMNTLMSSVGWAVSLVMLFMVILCIVIMVTPLGKIRLGGPNAKPKFSYMQWFGISLCTGIGAGVVFWGAAEPLLFAMEPSASTGLAAGSNGAVLWSMLHCFLQWGLTPYASCVIMGVILSYAILNMNAPFKASSCLVPIFGEKVLKSRWCDVFDAISAFALTGAVAGGLGYGAMQLSAAVKAFTGFEPSPTVYAIIIIVMFFCYNASAVSGLRNGITWLSNRNTQLFFILLLFVLLAGPTAYICNLFTESLGEYLSEFFSASLYTAPYVDSGMWPQNWDMYWWVDWMAYAPLLGLFMVRVAYGRTLREFVLIEWLFPALFGIIWFSVFGGTILHAQLFDGIDFYSVYLADGAEALTLSMFNVLPLSTIAKVVMLIIITVSLVTQCDSMTVTLAGMCMEKSDENTEAPIPLKLFWGIVFAVIALVFTVLGGIGGVKTIKSFCGIPLTFICLFVTLGYLRYMAKRPRKTTGEYEYEDAVKDAPDNGQPEAPKSKLLGKLGW
ncbi:BCCT family transporter [Butyricicoccus faecihominis]|uniref:BCCT family transporter n=1 Tax=Butyricicoccus faecihominis TaxID=1712515 RepID=UPI002478A9F2|nr:BCCT family transporter [Butyricicoccus faecihominis]MCQ5131157.1 BCCT family transporter [Butyricicoccus faecihominis]